MSELRHDPILKRWVIIATERSLRPQDFPSIETPFPPASICPFCPGNEAKTPPEIRAVRPEGGEPNGPGWKVRVVANRYPALRIEGEPERKGIGLYDRMQGIGAHEVVIENPAHNIHMGDMEEDSLSPVLLTYQERLRDLLRDRRFKYVLIFKNHGSAAGATLAHPHSQIIATAVTPRNIAAELRNCREHHHLKERCLFCDVIDQELETGTRLVLRDENYVTFCPYASRFPFELFLAPVQHRHSYAETRAEEIRALARHLKEVLWRLKAVLKDPPFNFVLHTTPNTETVPRRAGYWSTLPYDYHWHMEILPRVTKVAGFEWGTGFYINPTAPETAARFLREVR